VGDAVCALALPQYWARTIYFIWVAIAWLYVLRKGFSYASKVCFASVHNEEVIEDRIIIFGISLPLSIPVILELYCYGL
jgi:hypothetical protein